MKLRKVLYQMGFRPKLGSIFYSPTYDLEFELRKLNLAEIIGENSKKARDAINAQTTSDS